MHKMLFKYRKKLVPDQNLYYIATKMEKKSGRLVFCLRYKDQPTNCLVIVIVSLKAVNSGITKKSNCCCLHQVVNGIVRIIQNFNSNYPEIDVFFICNHFKCARKKLYTVTSLFCSFQLQKEYFNKFIKKYLIWYFIYYTYSNVSKKFVRFLATKK